MAELILKLEVQGGGPLPVGVQVELLFTAKSIRLEVGSPRVHLEHSDQANSGNASGESDSEPEQKKAKRKELSQTATAIQAHTSVDASFKSSALESQLPRELARTRIDLPISVVAQRLGTDTYAADVPSGDLVSDGLNIIVRAPDGLVLTNRFFTIAQIGTGTLTVRNVAHWAAPSPAPIEIYERCPSITVSGRVVDRLGKGVTSPHQIIFYGMPFGGSDEEPIAITRTSRDGHFSCTVRSGPYSNAKADISGAASQFQTGESVELDTHRFASVSIPLVGKVLPRNIILVVDHFFDDSDPNQVHDPCGCSDATNGDVSMDELVSSSLYREDIGGGKCADFTVPNRSIEEFSYYQVVRTTEPEVAQSTIASALTEDEMKVLIAEESEIANALLALRGRTGSEDYEARSNLRLVDIRARLQAARAFGAPTGRHHLDNTHFLDWDGDPTFFQATTVSHGHILHFKQIWRHAGYSIGDLVGSIPLAPGQKKQIVEFGWQRRDETRRSEESFASEDLSSSIVGNRDVSEILSASLSESMKGGSKARSWGLSGTFGQSKHEGASGTGGGTAGATVPIQGIPVSLGGALGGSAMGGFANVMGLAGGVGGASSNAWQDSGRSIAANSLQSIKFRTMEAASAVRSQRLASVQTATQHESVSVSTQVIANHNHCHAMTVQFFQCLRHFTLSHELVDVQECLLVPFPIAHFDSEKANRWEEHLAPMLLDRGLVRGFDAINRIQQSYVGYDLPTGMYADEDLTELSGEFRLLLGIPRPKDKDDGSFDVTAWTPYKDLIGTYLAQDLHGAHFLGLPFKSRVAVFREQFLPKILANFVSKLQLELINTNGSITSLAADFALAEVSAADKPVLVTFRVEGGVPAGHARKNIRYLRIRLPDPLTLTNLSGMAMPIGAQATVLTLNARYQTDHLDHSLVRSAKVSNDLMPGDPVTLSTPLSDVEKRNPRQEDIALAALLLKHLNANLHYYHSVIFARIDPQFLFSLIDGYKVNVQRPDGTTGTVSVASAVEPRIRGFAGNSMILPVSRGLHLDPTFAQDADNPVDLLDWYAPSTPVSPTRISVPTPGIFAEAIMGSCNSCEKKDESRFWRWGEAPIDEPTQILPVSTDSRYQAPPDMANKDFPGPMINIQGAPEIPDPTGLKAAVESIIKTDAFRDLSGLTENQKNAIEALKQSFAAATTAGAQSSDILKTQIAALQDLTRAGLTSAENAQSLGEQAFEKSLGSKSALDKTLESIESAKSSGMIDDAKANELAGAAIEKDTGPSERLTESMSKELPGVTNHVVRHGGTVRAKDSYGEIEVSGPTTLYPEQPPIAGLADWANLVSFRPPAVVQVSMRDRNMQIHKLEDAADPEINLDYFPILVQLLPPGVSADQLISHIRLNINDFVDPGIANFEPYDGILWGNQDTTLWNSAAPLGAVIHIDMAPHLNMDDGSVVTSLYDSSKWRFSTVKTLGDGGHPVSGNREFGIAARRSDYVIYTRGADRATSWLDDGLSGLIYGEGEKLWISFQHAVADWINSNGGTASADAIPRISRRYSWSSVKAVHRPTVDWLEG